MSKPNQVQNRLQSVFTDENGLERLIFFSDAVFAIAITLLALEIRIPGDVHAFSEKEMIAALLSIWPKYLSYLISFLVIGIFWISHHRRFYYVKRYDHRLLMLNLLLLMLIAFIPFPTEVISENGNQTATIFYALSIALTGLLSAAVWRYISDRGRLTGPLEPRLVRRVMINTLIVPAVFILSVGLALIQADLAKYCWILTASILFIN